MVNDPRQIRLRVRHPRLGRWITRSVERPLATGLEGALEWVTRRHWYLGAGRVPSSDMLRLGCAGYLRRQVKGQSDSAIAAAYRVRRQEGTYAINVFLSRAPADWALIFPSLSPRAVDVLTERCPLHGPGPKRGDLAKHLATRGTPSDHVARLTGLANAGEALADHGT